MGESAWPRRQEWQHAATGSAKSEVATLARPLPGSVARVWAGGAGGRNRMTSLVRRRDARTMSDLRTQMISHLYSEIVNTSTK